MSDIEINRVWAMPNKKTFSIKPIGELVEREVEASDGLWVDPFARGADVADVTNDLNPEFDTDYNMDAVAFLQTFDDNSVGGGVLFDPPYSPRQIAEVYEGIGKETDMETTQSIFWSNCKTEFERICAPEEEPTAISFGWNSGGIGKTYGFEKREILLVPHGGWHNDTICTVEDYNPS